MRYLKNVHLDKIQDFSTIAAHASETLRARLGLNYFQFFRAYANGSMFPMISNHKWMESAINNLSRASFSSLKPEQIEKQTYFFTWQVNLPDEALRFARNFDVQDAVTIVERHADYYDMTAFGLPTSHGCPSDFFLNHLFELKGFANRFRDKIEGTIEKNRSYHVHIDPQIQDPNTPRLFLPQKPTLAVTFRGMTEKMTMREAAFLKSLTEGHSAKGIATLHGLSHRTVENALAQIKSRFHCHFKDELLELVAENPGIHDARLPAKARSTLE